ncbi:MAG: hypothetical protein DWQ04_00665, partial [Chloroflexi bacterium]
MYQLGGEQLRELCILPLTPLPLTTMTIRNTFRKLFGVSQDPFPLIKLRPELLTAIEEIAAREQTSVGAVVNNLVSFALSQHQSAEAGLQVWYQLTRRER